MQRNHNPIDENRADQQTTLGEADRSVLDRVDARYYGDRGETVPSGVAPPCIECGARPAEPGYEDKCPECFGREEGDR